MPDDVAAMLRDLMRRLGLVYGAIDMRLTPRGDYVFLEINPAGQWLFIEAHSAQPITATIAGYLARNDRHARATGPPKGRPTKKNRRAALPK